MEQARVSFQGYVTVHLSKEDIEEHLPHLAILEEHEGNKEPQNILKSVAYEKLIDIAKEQNLEIDVESPQIDLDEIKWDDLFHPMSESSVPTENWENPHDPRERPPKETLSSLKSTASFLHYDVGTNEDGTWYVNSYSTDLNGLTRRETIADNLSEEQALELSQLGDMFADMLNRLTDNTKLKLTGATNSNPAQQMAREALKIAKELSSLLNSLAGLQNREEVATAAGLQELPTAIERLYALADQYRAGQVTNLQQPQQQVAAQYRGFDPDKLRRKAADPFIDTKQSPMRPVRDPAEEFRFERERTSSPHAADVPMEALADADVDPELAFLGNDPLSETRTIKCRSCGAKVELTSGWANSCDSCHVEYNGSGQMLAPREQWGEETGESF